MDPHTAPATRLERAVADCLVPLRQWARGRVPQAARHNVETQDLVQDAAVRLLARRDRFEHRHPAALECYLRRIVLNLARDAARRVARDPRRTDVPEDLVDGDESPYDAMRRHEAQTRGRLALRCLTPRDRALVIARLYGRQSTRQIADTFGIQSVDAARMAIRRALDRFTELHRTLTPDAPLS